MLRDYIYIDFDAIREKADDVLFAVAGKIGDAVNEALHSLEQAYDGDDEEPTVAFDPETFSFNADRDFLFDLRTGGVLYK